MRQQEGQVTWRPTARKTHAERRCRVPAWAQSARSMLGVIASLTISFHWLMPAATNRPRRRASSLSCGNTSHASSAGV